MTRKIVAVLVSLLLLVPGWLSMTGLTLPVALVPLLWISSTYDASRRSWWRMAGWATLVFVLWNAATVWWIGNATLVGPVAATLASTTLNLVAFMSYHTVSKKAPAALAYTTLVAAWIATEYWYTAGEFSWPWLILGNGFSHDVWAVQWYEYTGVFGGSLWVLVCNLLFFTAWQARRSLKRWGAALAVFVVPILFSLLLGRSRHLPDEGTVRVAIIQPDVDCYAKFDGDDERQRRNIIDLLGAVPPDARFILLPETAVPGHYWEPALSDGYGGRQAGAFWREIADSLRASHPRALLVTGANTLRYYPRGLQPRTAYRPFDRGYYDVFNSAVGLDSAGRMQLHHKGKLVIGVENTPTVLFDILRFLVIDLGGVVGQLGVGQHGTVFDHEGVGMGPAICYEGLYGDFFGDFVRRGAQFMAIVSNDGWWGDTPGYRHLFTISRLRAIEHRRAIARAANTGRSGFISPRGDVGATLGWNERGVLVADVPLVSKTTFYTRHGDYLGRIAEYVFLLCALYFIAYRVKRRNHLVE